jgi:hypothetical protein
MGSIGTEPRRDRNTARKCEIRNIAILSAFPFCKGGMSGILGGCAPNSSAVKKISPDPSFHPPEADKKRGKE